VVLQLGGWALGLQFLTVKIFVAKCHRGPRTWTDSLDERPKRKKMDISVFVYLISHDSENKQHLLIGIGNGYSVFSVR
jgi:hypothetical protein